MLSYLYVNNVKINEPTALAARKKQQNFKFAMRFKHQKRSLYSKYTRCTLCKNPELLPCDIIFSYL